MIKCKMIALNSFLRYIFWHIGEKHKNTNMEHKIVKRNYEFLNVANTHSLPKRKYKSKIEL